MNFNSQICTTKEQSERLLALGLKKETADMCINPLHELVYPFPYSEALGLLPAWSLHRLIEMYEKTCIFWIDCLDDPYEAMISRIANKIKLGGLNKEYLE